MARIRTIKPEFFMHDGLAELSPLHRLLYIGLWTQADREGRLLDRPRRIKASVLAYDASDIDVLLGELAAAEFIRRYEVDGVRIIDIPSFLDHQMPNHKEPPSTLPAPDGSLSDQPHHPNETLRQFVYERDQYACQYCGVDMREQSRLRCLDYVIPQAAGGQHLESNVVTACKRCKSRKGARTPDEAKMPWPTPCPRPDIGPVNRGESEGVNHGVNGGGTDEVNGGVNGGLTVEGHACNRERERERERERNGKGKKERASSNAAREADRPGEPTRGRFEFSPTEFESLFARIREVTGEPDNARTRALYRGRMAKLGTAGMDRALSSTRQRKADHTQAPLLNAGAYLNTACREIAAEMGIELVARKGAA